MAPRRGQPRSERAQALRDARRVQRTGATIAAAVLALVAAALGPLLTVWSIDEVNREFGVLAVRSPMTGSLHPFLLTYVAAGAAAWRMPSPIVSRSQLRWMSERTSVERYSLS